VNKFHWPKIFTNTQNRAELYCL